MRLRFTVFGVEVWVLDFSRDVDAEQVEECVAGLTGGSSHNFERDLDPPTLEEPWYEDRGFGFRL